MTVYRRRQCGLCDDALFELRQLSASLDFIIVEHDVDDDPVLRERYGDVIPVIAVGETIIAQAPIDATELAVVLAWALGSDAPAPTA